MKKIVDLILYNFIGKKGYHRFFLALKNIGLQGLNYRNTNIDLNGEHYFIKRVAEYYKKINQSAIIFDVGANIGNYAKVLKNTFKQNCHIFAFEPFSAPFIQLLQLKDHTLTPENLGLSNVNETLTVYTSNEFSEIGGVYNRDYLFKDIPHDKEERSSFVTLDFYCRKHKLDKINFLKIDVEGHEYAVLEGAKNLLEQGAIEFIQFEFGAGNHFSKTYFIDFHSLLCRKYKIYRLLKNDIIEVKDYNSDFEMLILTNFICIKNEIVKNFI